ncbi:MAG TPA: BRCT domain-containing protein, partial [Vicinamibacterales bacterium]|nr:BRCT domain-containing protein [Vicinamibacterales bacterium]
PENEAVIDALLRHDVTVVPYHQKRGRTRASGTVVFTGALRTMSRADASRLVERSGGRTGDSVTRATSLVVVGSRPGAKLQRARQLHVLSSPNAGSCAITRAAGAGNHDAAR